MKDVNIQSFSSKPFTLISNEISIKFNEMKDSLEMFRQEQSYHIEKGSSFKHPKFRVNIYAILEKLLIEIVYLSSTAKQIKKINEVYEWFKKTTENVRKLNLMRQKTYDFLVKDVAPEVSVKELSNEESINQRRRDEIHAKKAKFKLKEYSTKVCKGNQHDCLTGNDLFCSTCGSSKAFTINTILRREQEQVPALCRPKYFITPHRSFMDLKGQCDLICGKNSAIKDKRHKEEVKAALDDFGCKRAQFKENQNRKMEMKQMVKDYTELKPAKKRNTRLSIKTNLPIINLNKSPKIKVDQYHAMSSLSKNKELSQEQTIDMKMFKFKKSNSSMEYNFSQLMNKEKFNSDLVSTGILANSVFKQRLHNKALLNVNEMSNSKTIYKEDYTPMSVYDLVNRKCYSRNYKSETENSNIKTSFDCAKLKFHHLDSFLDIRKTMSTYKEYELTSLKRELKKKKRSLDLNSLALSFISPNENNINYRYFLPKSGSGLLSSQNM